MCLIISPTDCNLHRDDREQIRRKDIIQGLIRRWCFKNADYHYGAKVLKNLKEMTSKFHQISTVVMLDDKAAIPVGPPGAPVSATRRQRAVLQTGSAELNSTDHDHVVQHLTPSVSVVKDAPLSSNSHAWYSGVPEVIIKCAIFEPSNAFRHATEISRRLVNETKPLLFGITDGGSDHNTHTGPIIIDRAISSSWRRHVMF